jgi:hypothetical protein
LPGENNARQKVRKTDQKKRPVPHRITLGENFSPFKRRMESLSENPLGKPVHIRAKQ